MVYRVPVAPVDRPAQKKDAPMKVLQRAVPDSSPSSDTHSALDNDVDWDLELELGYPDDEPPEAENAMPSPSSPSSGLSASPTSYTPPLHSHSQASSSSPPAANVALSPIEWELLPPESGKWRNHYKNRDPEISGAWLSHELLGRKIDIVVDMSGVIPPVLLRGLAKKAWGYDKQDGYVVLEARDILKHGRIKTTLHDGRVLRFPPSCLRPQRTIPGQGGGTESICSAKTRVVVIGPDVNGGIKKGDMLLGQYAETMPDEPHNFGPRVVKVKFANHFLLGPQKPGYFPIRSLCRSLNVYTPGGPAQTDFS
ncbi:hypothetical protein C8R43DRAFT_1242588 [Mycena crocata]|nr:hypothetical protein C8R43DRAFT_1242588 [Mycena crocata]